MLMTKKTSTGEKMNINTIIETYVKVDDFFQSLTKLNIPSYPLRKRKSKSRLNLSEKVCISLLYHLSGFNCFKNFYNYEILQNRKDCFPDAVKYNTFIEYQDEISYYLYIFLHKLTKKKGGLINFVDSTSLRVCHPKRIHQHKVFKGLASRGHTSLGFFYGFKLHLIINETGDIAGFSLTKGNIDDRKGLKTINSILYGNLYGDKGYISKDLEDFYQRIGVNYKTKKRKNMKRKTPFIDKFFLRKRGLIETVIGQIKDMANLNYTKHRSLKGFLRNILSVLVAYQLKKRKPKMKWNLPLLEQGC